MSRARFWIVVVVAVVGIAIGLGSAARLYLARIAAHDTVDAVSSPAVGGPFSLIDHTGRPVTDKDFRGKYMLVFFGYTYCPDVCPTDLQVIGNAMDLLGTAGANVQPIFITVDPERDTVEVMADYVGNFHPRLLGLTGTKEQIKAAAKAYRVAYFKASEPPLQGGDDSGQQDVKNEENQDYLMNHTAFTYLMGPDGQFLELFPNGTSPTDMAAGIREYLNGKTS